MDGLKTVSRADSTRGFSSSGLFDILISILNDLNYKLNGRYRLFVFFVEILNFQDLKIRNSTSKFQATFMNILSNVILVALQCPQAYKVQSKLVPGSRLLRVVACSFVVLFEVHAI